MDTFEGMMKRYRKGPRSEDEALGYQNAHGDEQNDVDDKGNFADSLEARKGVRLFAQQASQRSRRHGAIKPCPCEVQRSSSKGHPCTGPFVRIRTRIACVVDHFECVNIFSRTPGARLMVEGQREWEKKVRVGEVELS